MRTNKELHIYSQIDKYVESQRLKPPPFWRASPLWSGDVTFLKTKFGHMAACKRSPLEIVTPIILGIINVSIFLKQSYVTKKI